MSSNGNTIVIHHHHHLHTSKELKIFGFRTKMLGHGIRGLTTRETEANLGRTVRWNSAVRLRQQGEEKLEKSDEEKEYNMNMNGTLNTTADEELGFKPCVSHHG
ncbi:hypothetical protein PGT21_030184 [Puccinia graminis f. sp. tritici]|uniref:Uncharacterized protein n=1 Tax=Puccinia graminis f. sp. tritici TaxID=56615 RepID=A0A5B0P5V3_PUCGR|nr:hypothetical protein PGT21_030184 [Puccinia graminis f. sp. tritici]KAA1108008.1 hypothetical protein PGTUg99_022910 [Puccinia graminis f. sp. tritici]